MSKLSTNQYERERRIQAFQFEEAKWLDSIVRPLVPHWAETLKIKISTGRQGLLKRLLHFCIDYLIVSKYLGIKIVRSQHSSMVGGKGFRPGIGGQRLDAVSVKILKKGKEIADRRFPVGITN